MKRRTEGDDRDDTASLAPADGSAGPSEAPEGHITGDSTVAASESRRPRGHVTVFAAWCKGCGICVEFCPQDVFETGHRGAPVVEHEERCTACGWCVSHCPDMAITVRRLAPEELAELDELQDLADQGALPGGQE
jgi:2-oxoglutarate ferredoxin oxidoreductase subunit delta